MVEEQYIIENKLGIHARPASEIVKIASKFQSNILLAGNNKEANAKSILAVMSMGIKTRQEIRICADGTDEVEAMKALSELIADNFHEE